MEDMEERYLCPECQSIVDVQEYCGFDCHLGLIWMRSYVCPKCGREGRDVRRGAHSLLGI